MAKHLHLRALIIFVVEPDRHVRHWLATYLREAGCLPLEAETGEAAISIRDSGQRLDVVFTEIRLKGSTLSGWDVGEAFGTTNVDMPVIYASGYPIEPPRRLSDSLCFKKAYRPSDILNACHRLCKHTAAWDIEYTADALARRA